MQSTETPRSTIFTNYFPYGIPIFYMGPIAFHAGELYVGIKSNTCTRILGDASGITMDVEYNGRIVNEFCYYGTRVINNKLLAVHIGIRPVNVITKSKYRKNIIGGYRNVNVARIGYTLSYTNIDTEDYDEKTSDSTAAIPGFTLISKGEYIISLRAKKWRYIATFLVSCCYQYVSNEHDYVVTEVNGGSVIKNLNKIRKESGS